MSFLSVEPQSRVLLESHSDSLLAQFDTQLQIIADRYLAFFRERRIIEATYIDSLGELHHKAKAVDASFDPRAEPTTTRTAWDKVRDSLEREANSHQAFVDILDNDVIKPLVHLKESNVETRKRIEEELKGSTAKYASLAENKIAKLQEAYINKYHHRQYADSTDVSQRPEDFPNKWFGDKVSTLFRGRREDWRRPEHKPEHAKSEEVSDDTCRWNVSRLNGFRLKRVENLKDGYNCLEELVFTPTVKDILVKYMDGMVTTHASHGELEMSTRAEIKKALAGTDMSDLRASFHRALSFSIPPQTLYRNYRPGEYSDLIFGVPLVDVETNEDVPKVMKMCIEEVEKRGLNTKGIYSVGSIHNAEVLELRRRFESEKTFSFSSTDKIHSVAVLLTLYLLEPLFMLSLQEYRNYIENRARYIENDFSVLRSKIRELHPVHGASLEVLLRHLLRVSSHSDENAMTVEALAAQFCYTVLRGNQILQDGVHVKLWRISFKMRISCLMNDLLCPHLLLHLMWQRQRLSTLTARF
ncbi:Rho GTPase activation protein [Lactarius vividus]|nr:Rho GTPase activation protein [Lactarius vividus]